MKAHVKKSTLSLGILLACMWGATPAAHADNPLLKFDFGAAPAPAGFVQVAPTASYADAPGYGFEKGATAHAAAGNGRGVESDKPFYFSAVVPEGNYKVTVTLGATDAASDNTVHAELRRLMLEQVKTDPGKFETRTFVVNVRQPMIAMTAGAAGGGGSVVRLKDREKTSEAWAWDNRLTLEFGGAHPAVAALEIEKVDVPTLFLMGDSTVCDQPGEPFNSWGQMITRFMKPTIAVSNQAESGEAIASSLAAGRLNKIWGDMKKGDYLFMQFGHNDMKATAANALDNFTRDFRRVVDETRAHGGIPVLFTPVSRRTFDAAGKITNSFKGYPDAVKQVCKEKDVPLIDLQAQAALFYEAMGPDASHKAFANASENTHHSDYGSYEIAKCILQQMKTLKLPLADQIVPEFTTFDPRHPDRFEDFKILPSPKATSQTPLGN